MRQARRKMLGVLLTLGMILGLSVFVSAANLTMLKVGDVIKEGDTIGPFGKMVAYEQYTEDGTGAAFATVNALTLIRVGKYYGFKRAESESNTIGYMAGTFCVTDSSDGLYVKKLATIYIDEFPYDGVILAVHEKHTHSYDTVWSSNDSSHWHACISTTGTCDAPKKDEATHSYGTSGDARFTCTVCRYENASLKAKAEETDKAAADKAAKDTAAPGQVPTVKTAEESAQTVSDPITINKVPAGVKAKAKKNKITVTWKKIKKTKKTKKLRSQIKSVQVQYATDQAFTQNVATKTVGKNKTKVVLKLKKKTTYYVRVRYVGSDGYSNWSKTKRVKTK